MSANKSVELVVAQSKEEQDLVDRSTKKVKPNDFNEGVDEKMQVDGSLIQVVQETPEQFYRDASTAILVQNPGQEGCSYKSALLGDKEEEIPHSSGSLEGEEMRESESDRGEDFGSSESESDNE